MTATFADFFEELVEPANPLQQRHQRQQRPKRPLALRHFQPDKDIMLWLRGNAPRNWQELKDLRYCLYHRCSRAGFKVKRSDKDHFTLTGRASSLLVVSNSARRYLLWQLRLLARKRGWVGSGKVRICR
jgi:hypothetical protein